MPRQSRSYPGRLSRPFVPLIPAFGKDGNDIPAVPLGDGLKLPTLVLDGLLCCGDAEIKGDPL